MRSLFLCFVVGSVLIVGCATGPAEAAVVLQFQGTINQVYSDLSSTFSVGQTVQGQFTLDPDAAATFTGGNFKQFDGAATSLSATWGPKSYSAPSGAVEGVTGVAVVFPDLTVYNGADLYGVGFGSLSGDAIGGLAPIDYYVVLVDEDHEIYGGSLSNITAALPDLSKIDASYLGIHFQGDVGGSDQPVSDAYVFASLQRLAPVAEPSVPEPGSLLIWSLLAALGIAAARWRHCRKAD
jgi:hypothetical protein